MSESGDKLRLKEKAEEDIYFAKRDRELIRALHEQNLVENPEADANGKENQSSELPKEDAKLARKRRYSPRNIAAAYRKLIEKVFKLIKG